MQIDVGQVAADGLLFVEQSLNRRRQLLTGLPTGVQPRLQRLVLPRGLPGPGRKQQRFIDQCDKRVNQRLDLFGGRIADPRIRRAPQSLRSLRRQLDHSVDQRRFVFAVLWATGSSPPAIAARSGGTRCSAVRPATPGLRHFLATYGVPCVIRHFRCSGRQTAPLATDCWSASRRARQSSTAVARRTTPLGQ